MKKVMIYLLLVCSTVINAQKYVPFPTENIQWNVFYASSINDEPMDTTLLQYSIQGDTTITGILYHKLCRNIGSNFSPKYVFAGGLREQDKKIYYNGFGYTISIYNEPINNFTEKLLYDFNKGVGESVYYETKHLNYTVSSIDSIKIGAEFRKRYKIDRYGSIEYIIEGIGNVNSGLFGIITPIPTCSMCHHKWEFICFSENGECVYKNPNFVDCGSTRKWSDIPYVPFPTQNASWSEIRVVQGSCEPFGYCKYQYKMLGDTTINSVQYHKIYSQDDSLATSKNAVYLGALREDAKKIYYRSRNCNQDIRLYDFSKNVGDTIQNLYSSSNNCGNSLKGSGTITAIDSVLIDGSYRRAFHLEYLFNDYVWIEGIGCTNGLFNAVVPSLTCVCYWYLICYHQNNQVKFVNNNSQLNYVAPRITCFPSTIDGVNTPAEKKSFTVSPNPVKDVLIVQFTGENVPGATMEVINVLGKRVKTISISNSSEYKLDLTDCSAGIYYVMLKYKNKTESQKIIKM